MIEYTIKVQRIQIKTGEILVYLNPQNEPELEPLRHVVYLTKDQIQDLASLDANAILDEVRKHIVAASQLFQLKWEAQIVANSANLPQSVLSVEGREFPVVTADEQDPYIPKPVEVAKTEEVVI